MKTAIDPRHQTRRKIIKELFEASYYTDKTQIRTEYHDQTKNVLDNRETIDEIIKKAAPEWPTEKINKVDYAILRLATYELQQKKEPKKVIIDEAIELAKEYGSEASSSFVNGVLGTICKTLLI